MVKRGFVVSDLHLFSCRSRGESELRHLRSKLTNTDLLVFNGDTFDLAWSNRPTLERVVADALKLIEELLVAFPHCHFYFLYGNHDCAPSLVVGLKSLRQHYSNLTTYDQYLRLGQNIFLHGDVCNYYMDGAGLKALRARYAAVVPRSKLAKMIYQVIIYTGLNRIAYLTHPRAEMIKRINYYLDTVCPEITGEVERIFFGHTHSPFNQRDTRGIEYINTGSAIRGLRANFTEFYVEE